MRHKPSNVVKIGRLRGTRDQHPLRKGYPPVQVSSKITLAESKPPLRSLAIKRGVFTWSQWDGTLWDPTALTLHRDSEWLHATVRTAREFHRNRIRSKQSAYAEPLGFGKNYYRATARAIGSYSLKNLHLLIIENKTIIFVLRTAPYRYYSHLAEQIGALNSSTAELEEHFNNLYLIRRILVHLERNPGYFKIETWILRVMGQAWARSANLLQSWRTSERTTLDDAGRLEAVFDTYPPHWTIEPLKFAAQMIMVRFGVISERIGNYISVYRSGRSRSRASFRGLISDLLADSRELRELLQEMAALRYYRLHRFPVSSLKKEIKLGQCLWLQLRLEALYQRGETIANLPRLHGEASVLGTKQFQVWRNIRTKTQPKLLMPTANTTGPASYNKEETQFRTNLRGLFAWKDWTGEDWYIQKHQLYLRSTPVRAGANAEENYNAIKQRVSHTMPRELDTFLMAHYKSEWMVNQSIHAFVRVRVNINVLEYLLRTAPPKISQRLATHITQLNMNSFEFASETERLRRIRAIAASLPHNPLFFKSLVKQYEANHEGDMLAISLQANMKAARSRFKAANGFNFDSRKFDHIMVVDFEEMQELARLRANSRAWQVEFPFNFVQPFASTVSLMVARQMRLFQAFRRFRVMFVEKGAWAFLVQGLYRAEWSASQMTFLNRDLAAIRYYRIQRFPDSTSEKVLELDQAIHDRVQSTRPWKWKVDSTKKKRAEKLAQIKKNKEIRHEAKIKARTTRGERERKRRCMGVSKLCPEPPKLKAGMPRKKSENLTEAERVERAEKAALHKKAWDMIQLKKAAKIKWEAKREERERRRRERTAQGIPEPPKPTSRMPRRKQIKVKKRRLREKALVAQLKDDTIILAPEDA
jgi:hypothetical protein